MKKIVCILILVAATFLVAEAQSPDWYFVRPDNTGIGGDYLFVVESDCKGNIWTGGYMPFYSNGSVVRFNYNDTLFTCWGNYDGYLPAGNVYDIAFDNKNGVWIATNGGGDVHGGIAHYDGTTWTQYTTLNTPLPADNMRGITVDGNNNVWATFFDVKSGVGGVAKFNGSTWIIYTPSNSNLQSAEVDKIKTDANNNIWIGTNKGLVKFDGINWVLYLSGSNVTDVEYDASTNKIYSATGGAINIYNGISWSQINSTNAPVSATGLWAVDAKGNSIIITTFGGTYLTYIYDGTQWITHTETGPTYDARIDLKGNFWICGNGFLEKFDGKSWKRYSRYNTGLVDYFNNQVFIDSKNRKWFANGNGGIQIFDCPHWEDYGIFNEGLFPSLQNKTSIGTSITEDSKGDIWMTYDGVYGYAIQVPGGNYKNYASWVLWDMTNAGTLFRSPQEAAADDIGHVFMRLYGSSVHMYDSNSKSWTNLNSGNSALPSTGLQCMAPRAGGKMYFGGFMFIYVLDNGAWSKIDFAALGLPITYVYDIAFDHNNFMWLATNHGVYKYNGTTWTNWTKANSNIAADHVTSIEFGKADTVFIGAHNTQTYPYYGGISIYTGTSWTSFLQDSSPIAHKQVEDVELDKSGNLWIITQSEGITLYKKGGVIGFDCFDKSLQSCNTTLCSIPANLTTTGITSAAGIFSWSAVLGAASYNVRYRIAGTSTWTTGTTTTTSLNIAGLTANTKYEWQLQTVCTGGNSSFTTSTTFTSDVVVSIATIPSELAINQNYPKLFQNPVTSGEFYLNLPEGTVLPATMQMFSMTGQKILQMELNDCNNTIHADGLINGLYIISVQYNGKVHKLKLQINK